MARARRDFRHPVDIWPGFVDALSTLILSIIFLLVVFVLAQFFLGQVLQGRDEAVLSLRSQVQDLTSQLGLEQNAADELRRTMARINADLQQAFLDRDMLAADLGESESARAQLAERMAAVDRDQALMQRTLDEMRVQAGRARSAGPSSSASSRSPSRRRGRTRSRSSCSWASSSSCGGTSRPWVRCGPSWRPR